MNVILTTKLLSAPGTEIYGRCFAPLSVHLACALKLLIRTLPIPTVLHILITSESYVLTVAGGARHGALAAVRTCRPLSCGQTRGLF